MNVKRLEEVAWSGYSKKVKLKGKPNVKTLLDRADDLYVAIRQCLNWYESSAFAVDAKVFTERLRVLIDLFGYDPYIGPLYRAVPVVATLNKKSIYEGQILKLVAAKRPVSSWTTSASNAATLLALGDESGTEFSVVKLVDTKAYQVMNTVFLTEIVAYLEKFKRLFKKAGKEELVRGLTILSVDLKRFKAEDEVTLLLKSKVKVQVVLIVKKDKLVRSK
jgi:hypothetical protein